MAVLSVGGLATGLDTNAIVTKLLALETKRVLDPIVREQNSATEKQKAFAGFLTRVTAVQSAFEKLRDGTTVAPRKASSSDATVLTAVGASQGANGQTSVTVSQLARSSIAASANSKASSTATVASGDGAFSFRLGSGATKSVAVNSTTTLTDLATSINALNGGVSASVVNLGTTASPAYHLRLASLATGESNQITVLQDDTSLGVAVTQAAQNANLTVSGFSATVVRESNTVDDLVSGATLQLVREGTATVTVDVDSDAIEKKLQAAVTAFNDLVGYVKDQSLVKQQESSDERSVSEGPLAFEGTVRGVLDGLRERIVDETTGLGAFSRLGDIGLSPQRDGTLSLDTARLRTAIGSDSNAVSSLLSGSGTTDGIADLISGWLTKVTASDGPIAARNTSLTSLLSSLEDRYTAGQRTVDAAQANLQATFANLETVVSRLQSQGSFLQSALGR